MRFSNFFARASTIAEPQSPHRRAHQVHPQQPRHNKVDVARAGLVHQLIFCRDRIAAPCRNLNRAVRDHPRYPRIGIRVVVPVHHAFPPSMASSTMLPVARARVPAASSISVARNPLSAASACDELRRRRAHRQHIRRPVAKRDPQPQRKQNGKNKDPEDASGSRSVSLSRVTVS